MWESWRLAALAAIETGRYINPVVGQAVCTQLRELFTAQEDLGRKRFLEMAGTGALALALAACAKALGVETSPPTVMGKPSETTVPLRTVAPTVTRTLRPSDTAKPLSETPKPVESCLINGTVFTEANRHPDGGYRYPTKEISRIDKPLDQWTSDEKTKIVDAAGNPIYKGVTDIANSSWAGKNRLTYIATWVGRGCGYGLMFEDSQGNEVWATDEQGRAMGRPDGNGLGAGVQAIPNPGIPGRMELVVGREQTAVWVVGQDQIIGRYNPVTQTWNIEKTFRPTETPVPTETLEPLVLNTNPENIKAFSRITLEDVTSGRFAAANRAVGKPFPPEAFTGTLYAQPRERILSETGEAEAGFWSDVLHNTQPSTRPVQWTSFNIMEVNGVDVVVGGLHVLNADGTDAYLAGIITAVKDVPVFGSYWQPALDVGKTQPALVHVYDEDCQKVWEGARPGCEIYKENNGEQTKLIEKWVATGIIPKELEQLPVGIVISSFWG